MAHITNSEYWEDIQTVKQKKTEQLLTEMQQLRDMVDRNKWIFKELSDYEDTREQANKLIRIFINRKK